MSLFSHDPSPFDLGKELLAAAARPAGKFKADKALALLAAGADVRMADDFGNSALTLAVQEGHTALVAALLDALADPNHRNNDLRTPLFLAAWYGRAEEASLLLKRGAKSNLYDRSGSSAADYARQQGHPEVAKIIQDAEAQRLRDAMAKAAAAPAPTAPAPVQEAPVPPAPPKVKWPTGFEL